MSADAEAVECRFCMGLVPARARKCKHCGEWLQEPPPGESLSRSTNPGAGDPRVTGAPGRGGDRVTCGHCHKAMIPRIITGPPWIRPQHGWTPVPKKSICPFCGGLHMKFPASLGQRIGATIFAVIAVTIVSILITQALSR